MSSSQNQPDTTWTLFVVGGVLFLGGWLIWHFLKHPMLEILRWLRFAELWTVNLFLNHKYDACLDWLRSARFLDPQPSGEMVMATNQCFGVAYLRNVSAEDAPSYYTLAAVPLSDIERGITGYIHWPIAFVFACFGLYTMFLSPRNKFRVKHNLESFIKVQAKMWPVISPIVNFNPIKSSARIPGTAVPDKIPLFAEPFSPEEWVAWHRIPVTNQIPDREATRRAFLLQLGPRWNGPEGQPPHVRVLYAAFALKGVQRREESDDLLGRISTFWSASGFHPSDQLMREIDGLIKDKKVGGEAKAITDAHAYRSTALLALLRWARMRGGVLAPAQFLWLRGTDRPLWYALNNLGRRAFHTEGAGALAHFMAEQNAQKPLPIPRIDTAIVTLNQYLAERGMPIPPREEAAH